MCRYDYIKANNFKGSSLRLIRKFAYQVLVCLRFLRRQKVLHCDLKPENILLKEDGRSGIKVNTLSSPPHNSSGWLGATRLHQLSQHCVFGFWMVPEQ